ncbi:YicC/YloC family endoribonuclease [Aeribacillus pallidus]|uniref:YicC family protein n=1 Tax=Aeribacillus pallidus TaxID=33936 RepID=A0A223E8M9_9BACI|nr:YicC/YloC family endoribonuclease [Aeribacillus pallidus]ASS91612.1 YicC family protein [Aeribacillus pallidus]
MVLSMTGFGRSVKTVQQMQITVEMRSVNHRFCEISVRMPKNFFSLEEKIKKAVQSYINRGRVELYITVSGEGLFSRTLNVDWSLAAQYIDALNEMKRRFHIDDSIRFMHLLHDEHIFEIQEVANENEELECMMLEAVHEAANQLLEMRAEEGSKLKEDLLEHLEALEQTIEHIQSRASIVASNYRDKLQKRLSEFITGNIDENRILLEVAIFADKSDITEELTRLESHLSQFRKTIEKDEPIGRKLDFIVQEMSREANTIGAKGNDSAISAFVVELKTVIEKLKEQVQNIE